MRQQLQLLGLLLAASVTCFIAGVYVQHEHANTLLLQLVQQDAYALYVSDKIFQVFRFFKPHNALHVNAESTRLQQIMKYGFPGLDDIRLYSDFVLSYDRRNRVAHWVCEHLSADRLLAAQGANRARARYRPDMSVPSNFRANLSDYLRSGFDRGHLAAAANHRSQQTHCNETFFLTNIAPQIGKGFNRAAWSKLEGYVRQLAERYGSVYVCTGPLYKPKRQANDHCSVEYEMIGSNMVAVPTHFFKVIIVESQLPQGKPYMEAYVLPNVSIPDDSSLRSFLCDIREIEHYAGLQFFDGLRRSALFGSNYPSESQVFRDFG